MKGAKWVSQRLSILHVAFCNAHLTDSVNLLITDFVTDAKAIRMNKTVLQSRILELSSS